MDEEEEEGSGGTFMNSFCDLVSLLLVFFVYLFSISTVDIVKFIELKRSVWGQVMVYKPNIKLKKEEMKNSEVKIKEVRKKALRGAVERFNVYRDDKERKNFIETASEIRIETLRKIKREQIMLMQMKEDLQDYIESHKLKSFYTVEYSDNQLEMSFGEATFFKTGSAKIKRDAMPLIKALAKLFERTDSRIFIEGHTDNVPIHNKMFYSNWELSAGRSAAVVRYLVDQGISPKRFVALGFGEFSPVAPNNSAINRSKNRRVKIILKPRRVGENY